MSTEQQQDREELERKQVVCAGCGGPKDLRLIVCWDCFKGYGRTPAYKYFQGSFEEWLLEVNKGRGGASK